ncbi:serine/threonine-protein kinase [Singulisphaera acidiphila]|uniref:WD40 repeat-containing protein n=1 Tax=Singulisphaera acidiphila (strain ATCC BAA-1392 / DSM 18658 / VKM B-2454 / MOB10) TaxID=886293 RepID=L0DEZ6_SINAD|nr:serine/threonine-protein kinase [Singulisphaera acidiphila]AGA27415.1 WD40 repeat-containing protein [Singulisphaera acidiphila DSM 18658]
MASADTQRDDDDPLATVDQSGQTANSADQPKPKEPTDASLQARGRYVPIRAHAKGGLGEVFVARDEELGREVALKAIQERLADDPTNRARFIREAEITGNLEHPGIVPIYGLGQSADGRPYYAMRFIEGETLAAAIDRFHSSVEPIHAPGKRSVALLGLLRRFNDVCNAIDYAHSRGILHRDLKPSNIMLGLHGETLVVDWGLAKFMGQDTAEPSNTADTAALITGSSSDQTLPGSTVGTPAFMSPEQAAGRIEDLGPSSDIYNLGATLYYLLTGQAPFDHAPAGILLTKVQRGDFRTPSAAALGPIPSALEAICLKAMALLPKDRYPSTRAIAEDIERWIADEPVSAQPESRLARLARWSRRHRAWVRAASAVLVGLVIVMSLATGVVHRAWQREQTVRIASEDLAASLDLDKGIGLCEQGTTGLGMLRLAHALAITPAGASDLRRTILSNLDAWHTPMIPLREMFVHPDAIWSVALSPNGRTLLTGSSVMVEGKLLGEARLWDVETGKALGEPLKHGSYVNSAVFSPDGKVILTGSADRTARLWDTATCHPLGPPLVQDSSVKTVAFAPDGRSFLTVTGRSVDFWDTATQRSLGPSLTDHPAPVNPAVFSADGSMIATGCEDGTALIWKRGESKPIGAPLIHNSAVNCLAFSPDGKVLATGDEDGIIQFWDTATQQRLRMQQAHRSEIYGMAFSPDGQVLATGGDDGTARYWKTGTGQALGLPMEHLGAVTAVAFAPDGRSLATGSGDTVARIWVGPTTRPLMAKQTNGERVLAMAYSPDGWTFVTTDSGRVTRIRDAISLEPIGPSRTHESDIRAVAYSPDGDTILTGASDGTAQLWTAADFQPVGHPLKLPGAVTTVAFRPDGRAFLAAGEDTKAHLWDPYAGRHLGPLLPLESEIMALGFSPDGQTIVTAEGRSVRFWEVANGVATGQIRRVLRGHQGFIYCLAFSRDSRLVATGSEDDTARIWEVKTGRPVGPPLPHGASIISIAFAPDGKTLLTGCNDQTARLWSLPTGRSIGPPLKHQGRVSAVSFHPSGHFFLTGSFDRSVRRWEAPRPWIDDVEQIRSRVQGLTGITLGLEADPSSRGNILDDRIWRLERRLLDTTESTTR